MLVALIVALRLFAPQYVTTDEIAQRHVAAASYAGALTGVDPSLLLAVAYVESRYDPNTVSRIECSGESCKRVAGVWSSTKKPVGARGTYYCGVMQVGGAITWDECVALRDIERNYVVGAQHIIEWSESKPCRKLRGEERLVCALRGYNGGWKSIERKAMVYPRMVLSARDTISKRP
jgi:hypothetical protein